MVELRSIPMVTVSTVHITPDELARINEIFLCEGDAAAERSYIDVCHNGIHMSPKWCGFIARIPSDEFWPAVEPGLTPEMRAIMLAARAQGAVRVDFDCDEDPVDLPTFEH